MAILLMKRENPELIDLSKMWWATVWENSRGETELLIAVPWDTFHISVPKSIDKEALIRRLARVRDKSGIVELSEIIEKSKKEVSNECEH